MTEALQKLFDAGEIINGTSKGVKDFLVYSSQLIRIGLSQFRTLKSDLK